MRRAFVATALLLSSQACVQPQAHAQAVGGDARAARAERDAREAQRLAALREQQSAALAAEDAEARRRAEERRAAAIQAEADVAAKRKAAEEERERRIAEAREARCAETRPGREERRRRYGADFWQRQRAYMQWIGEHCQMVPTGAVIELRTSGGGRRVEADKREVCDAPRPVNPWSLVRKEDEAPMMRDQGEARICAESDARASQQATASR